LGTGATRREGNDLGLLLVLFTIFMPVGIWGFVERAWVRRQTPARKVARGGAKAV